MRRPSVPLVKAAQDAVATAVNGGGTVHGSMTCCQSTDSLDTGGQRRRSSLWSNSSSRRGSIIDKILRRGSKSEGTNTVATETSS